MKYCMNCLKEIENHSIVCNYCGEKIKDNTMLHQLKVGTILKGRYYVGDVIGEGGFGIAYLGYDTIKKTKVAIKEYYQSSVVERNRDISSSVQCVSSKAKQNALNIGKGRLFKEAQILASLSKEDSIVHLKDFFFENNTSYIVMEYIEGQDLKDVLKIKNKLSENEVISLFYSIMKILRRIHEKGLTHLDISPDNIRMTKSGVKLLDFGASKYVNVADNENIAIILKHGYAPIEQYKKNSAQGPWTDIYALCATMYRCLTGKKPAPANERLIDDSTKKPSELGIEVSKRLEDIIWKGLSIHKEQRYQSIQEMLDDITVILPK